MREKDLQSYLYDNPEVLFPNQVIEARDREYLVEGKRVDLLFAVGGFRYIVEVKRDTIRRQDVGQVMEYYGRMRGSENSSDLRMMLVAPSIPDYWKISLKEFGIWCMEISHTPSGNEEVDKVVRAARLQEYRQRADERLLADYERASSVTFRQMVPPVDPRSMAFAHHFLRGSFESVFVNFPDYQVVPVQMRNVNHPNILCFGFDEPDTKPAFSKGGAWWAYALGETDRMPKNDKP